LGQYLLYKRLHSHFTGGRKCFILKFRCLLALALGVALQQHLGVVRLRPGQLRVELTFIEIRP
jgi:hypothetical protein